MNKYIVLLFVLSILFAGCDKNNSNVTFMLKESICKSVKDITLQIDDWNKVKQSYDYNNDIVDKSFIWSEPLLDLDEMFKSDNYTAFKDVRTADEGFEVYSIDIPDEINGNGIRTFTYLSGYNCVVSLKNEEKEVGLYNYMNNDYRKLFNAGNLIAADAYIYALEYNKDTLLFSSSAPGMDTFCDGKMWLYDMTSGQLELIYEYNTKEDGYTNIYGGQTQVLTDQGVYFSDCHYNSESSEYVSNLYFYDIDKKEKSLVREYAVLPMKYKDSYVCFVKDESSTDYTTLIDAKGNELWKVDEYYSDILSNGNQIYIMAYAFDHEKTTAKIGLTNLEKDYVFISYSSGGLGHITENYLMCNMTYLNPGYPFIYDISSDTIVELNMLPETSYFYFMKIMGDDSQVIINVSGENYLLKFPEKQ